MYTYVKTACIILKLRRGTELKKVCIKQQKIYFITNRKFQNRHFQPPPPPPNNPNLFTVFYLSFLHEKRFYEKILTRQLCKKLVKFIY